MPVSRSASGATQVIIMRHSMPRSLPQATGAGRFWKPAGDRCCVPRQNCMVWDMGRFLCWGGVDCSGLRVAHLVADRRRLALFCVAPRCAVSPFGT